jgi:phosphoribosylformylglycinamidine cyclo-ligase
VLGETKKDLNQHYVDLGGTLGDALLVPHRCYLNDLKPVLPLVKGLAHITGGGFSGNVPRVLPEGTAARLDTGSWEAPPLFRLIQVKGNVSREEMYHVFNMGIGMVVIASPENALNIKRQVQGIKTIGEIVKLQGDRVILD